MSNLDYKARPAKFIVRRMIGDCCRHLRRISELNNYQYVGFGGLEFLDFDLFHRTLGIRNMISIENSPATDRYEFNKPFAGIEMRFGNATTELTRIDWEGLKIVWLDYERSLHAALKRDCEYVVRNLGQGSLFIVTMNAEAPYGRRLDYLKRKIGDRFVPDDATEEDLDGWGVAKVQRRIISEAFNVIARSRHDRPQIRQLLNFNYKDGARMQTLAWIISSDGMANTVRECGFDELDFYRPGETPMTIELPILTSREVDFLNRQLPLAGRRKLKAPWLHDDERRRFAELYRWYPAS